MTEVWRKLKDDDFISYRVSNMGRVCNKQGKILPSKGNHITLINRQGAYTTRSVAKLVANAFELEKPMNQPAILGHKDGDVDNNRLSNLFWDTDYFNKNRHRKSTFNKLCMDCLHSIEHEFGSIMNVPENDERWLYIKSQTQR